MIDHQQCSLYIQLSHWNQLFLWQPTVQREATSFMPTWTIYELLSNTQYRGTNASHKLRTHNYIFVYEWFKSILTSASSSMVNSPGLPKLKGPTCSPSINAINPSTWKNVDTYSVVQQVGIFLPSSNFTCMMLLIHLNWLTS